MPKFKNHWMKQPQKRKAFLVFTFKDTGEERSEITESGLLKPEKGREKEK